MTNQYYAIPFGQPPGVQIGPFPSRRAVTRWYKCRWPTSGFIVSPGGALEEYYPYNGTLPNIHKPKVTGIYDEYLYASLRDVEERKQPWQRRMESISYQEWEKLYLCQWSTSNRVHYRGKLRHTHNLYNLLRILL